MTKFGVLGNSIPLRQFIRFLVLVPLGLGIGAGIGLIGSIVSMRKHLKGIKLIELTGKEIGESNEKI